MEDKYSETNSTPQQSPEPSKPASAQKKKKSPFKWVLLIVFALMMVNLFRPQHKPSMNWLDYEAGIKAARQQNKPLMIAFYKSGQRFSDDMWADTYANKNIIKYIQANFIPVLVDSDKSPDLVKEYEVTYFPLHIFKTSDNKEIVKTRRGYDTPGQFMPVLNEVLEKLNRKPK